MTIGLALFSTAALADAPRTIAFSVKTVTNDDFQKAIATSIQDAVEKSGNKFLLVTAGEETGVSIQVNQVEDLIAKKVDAIILSPMDGKAVVPAGASRPWTPRRPSPSCPLRMRCINSIPAIVIVWL